MDEPSNAVIIERVDNVKTQLNGLSEQNDKDHTAMREFVVAGFKAVTDRQDIQNGRISKLEKWQWSFVGIISFISFCATVYAAIKH